MDKQIKELTEALEASFNRGVEHGKRMAKYNQTNMSDYQEGFKDGYTAVIASRGKD